MAPRNIKKVKSRRGELYGIRARKGCCKPTVELRLPGGAEKIWRVMADEESAKRFVKFVCLYTDGEKAFPPDHPDLPHLEAFRKKEFEAFVWEEFQRNDATELLEDTAHGLDHGKRVEPMMPTNAPESGSVHFEVGTFAGDVQLEHERKVAQERLQVAQERLQVAQERLQVAQDRLELADLRCAAPGHRSAREGVAAKAPMEEPRRNQVRLPWTYPEITVVYLLNLGFAPTLENGVLGAPPPLIPFEAGPSDTRGFAHPAENAKLGAPPAPIPFEAGPSYARGFAPTLENGVLGAPPPLIPFEAGPSDTRGFAHPAENAKLGAPPASIPFEVGPSYARGSIASPECDDWAALSSDIDKYFADAS